MSYRNILVYLNDARRARKIVQHAAEIARAFEARLVGLHVTVGAGGREGSGPALAIEGLQFSRNEEADHLRAVFEEVTTQCRVSGEFRQIKAGGHRPIDIVIARAFAADLVVAGQTSRDWMLSPMELPAHVIRECGRPVLIVSENAEGQALPQRVVLAWNQQREATRAIYDALPLLRGASAIELLVLEEPGAKGRFDGYSDPTLGAPNDFVAGLVEHGVRPVIVTMKSSGTPIGQQICARAKDQRADLLVMGAYGQSPMRELLLGGPTHYVLSNMSTPTLFSH
ncbi:MAG: universal stress protein [Hyphomicrobiaceae bacterium]